MKGFADLHIHTHFSDGSQSPKEVVDAAGNAGLSLISVCDHNTDEAYHTLPSLCAKAGISLIRGMEVDAEWRGLQLHILAYGYAGGEARIEALKRHQKAEYDLFDEDFILNVAADYPMVRLEDYHAYETPSGLGGWQDTNYLVACGAVQSVSEGLSLFKRYGKHSWHFLPLYEICRIIRAAGGVPVLAHPGNWFSDMPEDFNEILEDMRTQGIGGIECYYPAHSKALTDVCVSFCQKHDMAVTAGGDGHGTWNRVIEGTTYDIGVLKADVSMLNLKGFALL